MMGYVYLALMLLATLASQLMVKWRINTKFHDLSVPSGIMAKIRVLSDLVFDPVIFLSMGCTFCAGILWVAVMTKFEVSYAYPFTSLGFVLVLIFSALLLGETLNAWKVAGVLIIILGVFVASRG